MPETRYTNGYPQSGCVANEFHDEEVFLFSSESVGEGHPGKLNFLHVFKHFMYFKRAFLRSRYRSAVGVIFIHVYKFIHV